MTADCTHPDRVDGVCATCGDFRDSGAVPPRVGMDCEHDVILNGACLRCGTTELDPEAMSPKKSPPIIPADRLRRR